MSEDKEARIIEAAIPLFVGQGLKRTTVEQIAAAAGIGKGTVYLYFKSKGEIFSALVRREATGLYQQARSAVRREARAEDQLRAFLRHRVSGVKELLQRYQVPKGLVQEIMPEIGALEQELRQIERGIVDNILEGGVERGEFAIDDVTLASIAISASLKALEEPWWYGGRELADQKKVDVLVDLFIKGLRGERSEQ